MLLFDILYFTLIFYLLVKIALEANNPLNSLIRMISLIILYSIYLIENHLQYFGFILIIIYVGAIAIMFLFVIFLMNENLDFFIALKDNFIIQKKYLFLFIFIILFHLFFQENILLVHFIKYYSIILNNYLEYLNFYFIYQKNYIFNNYVYFYLDILNINYNFLYFEKKDFELFFKILKSFNLVCFPIEMLGLSIFIKNFFSFFLLSWLMFIIPLLIIFSCKLFFTYKQTLNAKVQVISNQNEIEKLSIFKY